MRAKEFAVTERTLTQWDGGKYLSVRRIYQVRPIAELKGFPDWELIGFPLSFHPTELGARRAMARRTREATE